MASPTDVQHPRQGSVAGVDPAEGFQRGPAFSSTIVANRQRNRRHRG